MQILSPVGYSLYQLFLLFCFWSFAGWCIEVIDMTYETGEYQNRGFLNMPICPIEGLGVVMVTVFFRPIQNTVLPLFLASTALCTSFELFVGLLFEKLFHARWWDYSNMKFNYKGLICLRNSLFFGAGCVVCLRWVNPLLLKGIAALPVKAGLTFVVIMSVLIVLDTVASIMAALKLKRKIERLDTLSKLMLNVSVKTGMRLASGTLKVKSNVETVTEKAHDIKENVTEKVQTAMDSTNLEKLRIEYDRLLNERDETTDRFLKAFPRMKSLRYAETLALLRSKLPKRPDRREKTPVSVNVEESEISNHDV